MIRSDVTYHRLTGDTATDVKKADFEYVLFPTWVFTYKGRGGKLYHYAMNGQTGEICGKLPISGGKLWRDSGILAAAIAVLICIGGWFFA